MFAIIGAVVLRQYWEGVSYMTDYEKAVALWQERNIRNDAELAMALRVHSSTFAYHSGKMANDRVSYFDVRKIFDHDSVFSYTGDIRTLFEIYNAKKAYEFVLAAFNDRRKIDVAFIKELQKVLTQSTYDIRLERHGELPGEYKLHEYYVGQGDIGALPEDVDLEIEDLLDEIQEIPEDQALVSAAYFHAVFESIHPFADGNGRCGRLAMNYFLVLHNHPPIIIHEEDHKAYLSALERWDLEEELRPFCFFLKEQTTKTWKNQLERNESQSS